MLTEFLEKQLELESGWRIQGIEDDTERDRILIRITFDETVCVCPKCGESAKVHDRQTRSVRHLDFWGKTCVLEIEYPRLICRRHGRVTPAALSFEQAGFRISDGFYKLVVYSCQGAATKEVAKKLRISWTLVDKIKRHAFEEAKRQQRQQKELPKVQHLAIDETSFQKHHNYSTILTNAANGKVIAVLDDRKAETLEGWFKTQRVADFTVLKSVSMDMAPPYIKAVRGSFPHADQIICYDRFHVAQLFGRAIDAVRRRESAEYRRAGGDNPLAGTRFEWLRNSGRTDNRSGKRRRFLALTRGELKRARTTRAWALKETAAGIWDYARAGLARKAWGRLIWRLSHSRIAELKKLGRTIREHLWGILNAIRLRASNAIAEARNSAIQRIKRMACGYRNKARFNREILFQFGVTAS